MKNEHVCRRKRIFKVLFLFVVLGLTLVVGLYRPRHALASNSFRLVNAWAHPPASVPLGFVTWVDVDPSGLVYVFRRCPTLCGHPGPNDPPGSVLLFDSSGNYLREWEPKSGEKWKEAHAISIDKDGFVWTTDVQLNVVRKYKADGTLLMTLGKVGVAGETSDTFNQPTNVFVAKDGSIFVTDGYGNQRVVKFNKDGRFVKTWGQKGTGAGEFRIPHAVTQDQSGHIIVADRCGLAATKCTDGRIQVFDTDGNYLSQWTPPGGIFAPFALAVDTSDRLYIDDWQTFKVWILDAKSMKVLETVDGASGHGMGVSRNGSDIYVTDQKEGVHKYSRTPG